MNLRSIQLFSFLFLVFWTTTICRAQLPELVVQSGHNGAISSIAYSPDGRLFATAGAMDNTVKLWDSESGIELRTLVGHTGNVNSVKFSPDGKTLASGAFDRSVRLWDVTTGSLIRKMENRVGWVYSVAFSPDGSLLATGNGDETVKLWEIASDKPPRSFAVESVVVSVDFSSDGKTVASASLDKVVRLWDVERGIVLRQLDGHSQPLLSVAFSPDGRTLASSSRDTSVILWVVATGEKIRTLNEHRNWVNAVAFSPDGKFLATGSGDATLMWEVGSGVHPFVLKGDAELARGLAFSPDGSRLASCGSTGKLKFWDTATGNQIRVIGHGSQWVHSVAYSPNGNVIAAAFDGKPIKFWSIATGIGLDKLPGDIGLIQHLAYSPDSKTLAGGSLDRTIQLWDLNQGAGPRVLEGHSQSIESVAFSRDGKFLASGSLDNSIRVWNAKSGALIRTLEGHVEKVTAVEFSPDGKTLISGGYDNKVKLWDLGKGKTIREFPGPAFALSPGGQSIATNGPDDTIQLWNLADGTLARTFAGSSGLSDLFVFSADGRVLANNTATNQIKLWDVEAGKEIRILPGHGNHIESIVFSPDGKLLISGGWDGKIKFWRLDNGAEIANLVTLGDNDWIVITPDGLFDGTSAAWKSLLWRFNNNTFDHAPVEAFYNEYYYPGLLADILASKNPKAPSDISQKDRRQVTAIVRNLTTADEVKSGEARRRTLQVEIEELPAGPDVSIKGKLLAPSGAKDIRLFRNGSLVRLWRGDWGANGGCKLQPQAASSDARRTVCTIAVPIVAGENHFTAYAFNHDNVKGLDGELTVTGPDTLERKGVLRILAVGVSQYANSGYNLNYTTDDATSFAAQLKQEQEKLGEYQAFDVKTLLNADATKANILAELKRLAENAQPEDAVVVYFSGHGKADGDRFYLIPHDLGYTGPRDELSAAGLQEIIKHSISDLELEEAFRGLDAGRLFMIIDACNSGQALENKDEPRRGPMNTRGLAQLAYEKGMYILTASQNVEEAFVSARLKHSYLTFALGEGLKSKAADTNGNGAIDLREWFDYATARVPKLREEALQSKGLEEVVVRTAKAQKSQTPRVFYRREPEINPLIVARP